jgi:HEAT repeat protein
MTRNDAKTQLLRGNTFEAWEAAEYMRKHVQSSDLSFLISIFENQHTWAFKSEIVDIIGLINSEESITFLKQVARSRAYYLIRYYALRNLIDLGCDICQSAPERSLKKDFYKSLAAYSEFVHNRIDLNVLQATARSHSKKAGDHWYWLTQPLERPKLDK